MSVNDGEAIDTGQIWTRIAAAKYEPRIAELEAENKRLSALIAKIAYWKPMETSLQVLAEIRGMVQDEVDREMDKGSEDDKPDSP